MKILILLLALFLIPSTCFATLDADTIFEFRSTATANMVNGGGFNSTNAAPGTDYSTNDAAHLTITDLVIGNPDNTTVTSALTPFDSLDPGNILHITAGTGFTVGWYEVVSVAGSTATLDRACGTAGSTGGTAYLGGALNIGGSLEDDFFEAISGANASDGITVYFYNNNTTTSVTFTPSEGISLAGAGGTQAPIKIIGYKTTRGDNPTGTSRPTIALGTNSMVLYINWEVYNLMFTGTTTTILNQSGGGAKTINCKITNSSSTTTRVAINISGNNLILNCEAISYFGRALTFGDAGNIQIINCYLHDSDMGIRTTQTAAANFFFAIGNIIEGMVTTAINSVSGTSGAFISHNTLYGSENTTGTGVNIATGGDNITLLNNIIYGFATGVSHVDTTQTIGYDDYNDYNNNDTDVSGWVKGSNDSAVAPGFTSVAQVTGTAGAFVAGGSKLVDTTKNFTTSGVVAGDVVYIVSGTGVTAGNYLIDSISTTTNPNDTLNITIPASPGTNTTADKVYQITTGHNFAIGTNLKALGFPGTFQAGFSTGYTDIGAVQRQEPAAGTGGGASFFSMN